MRPEYIGGVAGIGDCSFHRGLRVKTNYYKILYFLANNHQFHKFLPLFTVQYTLNNGMEI